MLEIEDYRSDKDYMLDSVSYEEIFDAFKDVVNETLKKFMVNTYVDGSLEFRKDRCNCRMAYGADKDLYPKIKLDMGKCFLILTTFEVKLLFIDYKLREVSTSELDKTLVEFMCNRFPLSYYLEKRDKYFKDAELMKRTQYNWMLQ